MQIFLVNLDRHPARLKRMLELLKGASFKRIAAVDGRTIEGLETRDPARPMSRDNLSRYEKACILSHRKAWLEFLAGSDDRCCILEDDVFIGPDFFRFMNDESWIPQDGDLVKIETFRNRIFVSRKEIHCLNRSAAQLLSLHFGTGAYILSRGMAEVLLEETCDPQRTLDRILFDETAIARRSPIYQLLPALCIQGQNLENGILFQEMQSAIKPKRLKKNKTVFERITIEVARPLRHLKYFVWAKARERQMQARHCIVPFK
ncbi:MAG TPA: glycosyltransferase family 25 protein [Humisphaera sp.]|nr:glycosyltransferase family 25 protein [Humisphaera sp.]